MRDFAEPKLRGMLDRFSDVLFRHGLEETTGAGSGAPRLGHRRLALLSAATVHARRRAVSSGWK
ncbi:hypothetical protein [Streptomyces chrestomyceticus]|uniref:hypothetical protein n=1 Tax=Streptomyces chrestomyceticus TaxID=68185 RepID=UPI0033EBEE4B